MTRFILTACATIFTCVLLAGCGDDGAPDAANTEPAQQFDAPSGPQIGEATQE